MRGYIILGFTCMFKLSQNRISRVVAISFFLISVISSISAYSIYVYAQADPQVADGSFDHPFTHIQHAINKAFDDDLTTNSSGPPVEIIIQDYPGGYIENVALDYSPLGQPHFVNDVTIRSSSDSPADCMIIANDSSSPVVMVKGDGNSKFKLKGVTIKHTTIPSGIINKGVSFYDPSVRNHYFDDVEIDNCKFSNNLIAVEFDYVNSVYLSNFRVNDSIIDLTHSSNFQSIGINTRAVVSADNAVISNNVFERFAPVLNKSEAFTIGPGFESIEIVNNDFSHAIVSNTNNYHAQNYMITNNNLYDSHLAISSYGTYVIDYNRFIGLTSYNDPSAISIERGSQIQITVCSILSNQFWGCHSPIEILTCNIESAFGSINTSVINNSFIDCAGILSLQSHSNFAYYPNLITDYRNNLYDGPSHNPFTITDQLHNPLILTGNNRIPISYSHFKESLTNVESLSLDVASISYGEPYLNRDEINFTCALRWDEDIRSPLIMAGSDGYVTQCNGDKLDIGAIQYQEYPHEYRTYTFPPYSVRNGLKWMSFPTIDRIWNPVTNEPDVAGVFFNPILNNMILHDISWKVQDDPQQDIHYSFPQETWVGDQSHFITPQQGYKIQMAQGLQTPINIAVPGLIPDLSQYPLTIKALPEAKNDPYNQYNDNWLGYFNTETTNAEDAFASVIDNIWYIQTQNWTMVRERVLPGSPWIYAIKNKKNPTLSYGDMVVVKCFSNGIFVWNTESASQIPVDKEFPRHYIYTEKADYVPFYVELDADDLPSEVAIFVDNICKGATVVCDSLVEIPGYILDATDPDSKVEILAYYEDKAAVNRVPAYRVWNPDSGTYDDKPLNLSSKNHYYRLKLQKNEDEVPAISELALSIHPNPFNPSTTIKFCLAEPADIKLEIYNQKGQLVKCLTQGKADSGWNSITWNGIDSHNRKVASGLYFCKLSYNAKSITKKMILMK